MKVILRSRAAGKTTELIKMSAERGGYIVCFSQDRCSEIFAQAKNLGLKINFPLTFFEFLAEQYGNIREFYLDDVDVMLQRLSRVPIVAISVTGENNETI